MENSLAIRNPELAKQWHETKNGKLTPFHVTFGSNKKAWWKCEKEHEWEASTWNRHKGRGCPYCANKKVCIDNCLATLNPEMAKKWHLFKNVSVDPSTISFGSERKVWWQCKKGHEWEISIYSRTRKKTGCPYCSGRNATIDNCLAKVYPEISKEWHPFKNGLLNPYDVTPKSGRRVWWMCEKGHEWQTTVHQRGLGTNCPFCKPRTSFPEQTIFYFINNRFKNTLSQHLTEDGVEFDIFNSELSFVIEYDGYYWNRKRYEQDVKKSEYVAQNGFLLIRVREEGLQRVNNNSTINISVGNPPSFNELNNVISEIFKLIFQHNNLCCEKVNIDTENKKYEITKLFKKKILKTL